MGRVGPLARSAVIIVLAVSGGVAAFATIAPPYDAEILLARTSSVEDLPIPPAALLPSPESYIREERFQGGDTLAVRLWRLGVSEEEIATLVRLRPLQDLRPGSHVTAE